MTKEKLIRCLDALQGDFKRMEGGDDFDIFDVWEIGEIAYVLEQAVSHLKGES